MFLFFTKTSEICRRFFFFGDLLVFLIVFFCDVLVFFNSQSFGLKGPNFGIKLGELLEVLWYLAVFLKIWTIRGLFFPSSRLKDGGLIVWRENKLTFTLLLPVVCCFSEESLGG